MKNILIVLVFSFSQVSVASNLGLGLSAESGDNFIYFPIVLSDSIRLEPFFGYSDDGEESISGVDESYSKNSYKSKSFGAGLFKYSKLNDNVHSYFGGRIAYIETERKTEISISLGENLIYESLDGYSISPTIGIEYRFANGFSTAVEAEWYYNRLEGQSTGKLDLSEISETSRERSGTGTKFLIRYVF